MCYNVPTEPFSANDEGVTMTTQTDPLTNAAGLLLRSDAGVLALTDSDRVDFLQRMTTNNIAALRPGQAAVTVLTSPTARIVHVFTVLRRSDDLLLLPAPGESAALERHLRGQIFFMDKVRVHNLSADFARLRLAGAHAGDVLSRAGLPAPQADDQWHEQDGVIVLAQQKYEAPGYEILAPAARAEDTQKTLEAAGAVLVAEAAYAARLVQLGRPAAGAELTPDYSPLEAGLAWACADDKGCYTGQEIIARQQTYDKVTRTLVGLRSANALTPGAALTADGRDVGLVTSVATSEDGAPIALAIVKRPHNEPSAHLRAGEFDVEVVALPA